MRAAGLVAIMCACSLLACKGWNLLFACDINEQCDPGKRCVAHACAAADPTCPALLRWDESAGDRSGQCIPPTDDAGAGDLGNTSDAGELDLRPALVPDLTVAPDMVLVGCAGYDNNAPGECWYLGALGDSCNQTCATHGGYDDRQGGGTGVLIHWFPIDGVGACPGDPNDFSIACYWAAVVTICPDSGRPVDSSFANPACQLACSCMH